MAGEWIEQPDRSWRWDDAGGYGAEPVRPAARSGVYDPAIGSDGGGRYADPAPVAAISPDRPVRHVDELRGDDGPAHWIGPDPEADYFDGRDTVAHEPVCCQSCGSYVHPDRLR